MSTDETTYYDEGEIKITSARAILGKRTYAMSGITSVSEHIKSPSRIFPLILFLIAGVGVMVALGSEGWVAWVVSAAFAAFGVFIWRTSTPVYSVRVGSASGEANAYASNRQEQISKIVEAINTAIIKRG